MDIRVKSSPRIVSGSKIQKITQYRVMISFLFEEVLNVKAALLLRFLI
jgi:hypothetical protein